MTDLATRRRERIERQYAELSSVDYEALKECEATATRIVLNRCAGLTDEHRLALAADIEAALVDLAWRRRFER